MKKVSLTIIASLLAIATHAQNGINSPYSRYGFGIQSERAMGFNKGMGGVAQGFRNGQEINIANPASYSAVDSLTALFDMGISLQNNNYKMDGLQRNVRNTSLDYFALQFRAASHLGMTVGLMPLTNIKYSFASSSEPLAGKESVTSSYSFSGDGGLREVFLGAGWNPAPRFSIGVNASYVWGSYTHNMTMAFSESSAFSMARIYAADISTYNVQAGAQYVLPINTTDKVAIGATYTLGHKVGSNAYRTTQTMNGSSVELQTVDTIPCAFQLPHAVAAGITYYHKNNLRIGADFELQKWSQCKFPNQQTGYTSSTISSSDKYQSTKGQLYDRTSIAVGADWVPNRLSKSLFRQSTYKLGGYYSQSYAKADVTGTVTDKPYEYGLSAGMSIPINNRNIWHNVPYVNLALQWVHTSIPYLNATTLRQSALTENYIKFCVGVTFSERWFYKWKVQ